MRGEQSDSSRARGEVIRLEKDRIIAEIDAQCRAMRIRVLAGGGTVFTAGGLISPAISPAASLVVDPASFHHLLAHLRQQGWTAQAPERESRVLPSSTMTLAHPDWVAGLHLFSVIPGFFADPEVTFDVLWERRQHILINGMRVPALDRIATAMFATHDRLSGRRLRSSNFQFFATQFERAFTESDKADLRLLIKQVGASNEMKPLLLALGIEPLPPTLPSHWYTCWRLEIEDPSDEIVVMLALIEASPDRRRVLLWSMLDPRSAAQNWRTIRTARTTIRAFTRARRRALAAR